MAEIREIGEKGKRTGQRVGKSASQRVGKMATRRAGKAAGLAESNATKPRKRRVKGYGVDRLRAAAERRMAESSEALAETLISKALEGKLESVKILMRLAEEEKARREEAREEDAPGLADLLVGSVVKVGQMWDGHEWRRVAPNRILAGPIAKSRRLVNADGDVIRIDEDLDRMDEDFEGDGLEAAA
jgi:hypothetical protein